MTFQNLLKKIKKIHEICGRKTENISCKLLRFTQKMNQLKSAEE
jgi:hypothetical protein